MVLFFSVRGEGKCEKSPKKKKKKKNFLQDVFPSVFLFPVRKRGKKVSVFFFVP